MNKMRREKAVLRGGLRAAAALRAALLRSTPMPTPSPANTSRATVPRLIPLLASFLFAIALVHANRPFLLTAILPGITAILAPHHPPGLGEGEQTLR